MGAVRKFIGLLAEDAKRELSGLGKAFVAVLAFLLVFGAASFLLGCAAALVFPDFFRYAPRAEQPFAIRLVAGSGIIMLAVMVAVAGIGVYEFVSYLRLRWWDARNLRGE